MPFDSRPVAELFSQGEEVLTGQIADTNAAWLSDRLCALGFRIGRHTVVGDRLDDLVAAFREIAPRADCCLVTGGLGPTVDDLTAAAVAAAFGLDLRLDAQALAEIETQYALREVPMPPSNRKQALLPEGALRLSNPLGTAPGFAFRAGRCWFACMPGVPGEMRVMYSERVQPELERRFVLRPWTCTILHTFGAGESRLQELLDRLRWPPEVGLSFRAAMPEVQVKLWFDPDVPAPQRQQWTQLVAEQLRPWLVSVENRWSSAGGLVAVTARGLRSSGRPLQLVETLTAGQIAAALEHEEVALDATVHTQLESLRRRWGLTAGQDEEAAAATVAQRLAGGGAPALVQLWNFDREALADRGAALQVVSAVAGNGQCTVERQSVSGEASRKRALALAWAVDLLRRSLPVAGG